MNRYLKAAMFVIIAGILTTTLTACGNSHADSGGGVSQAAFDQLKATVTALQQQVTDLTSSVSVVSTGGNGKHKLAEGDACTYVGWLPADKPIYQANSLQCRSATGYLFALPAPDGGQPLRSTVYYASSDCSGTPYIATQDLSAYGRTQGAVFTYGNDQLQTNVGYVVPNTTLISGTMNSTHRSGACQVETVEFANEALAEVLPNDPATTDVSNEPYPGPVVIQ